MGRLGPVAAALGALAVAMGAFGAHALQPYFTTDQIDTWNTASHYLIIHVLAALLCVALSASRVGWGFVLGAILFSGSLYGYLLSGLRPLVFVTPLGGVVMVLSWLWLGVTLWKKD